MLYLMDKKIILSNLLFSIVITKATTRLKVTWVLSHRGSRGSTWRHGNHIYGVLLTASINENHKKEMKKNMILRIWDGWLCLISVIIDIFFHFDLFDIW